MHQRNCIESLERRVLLASGPELLPITIIDDTPVATITWHGQQVQMLAGRWVVKLAGYSGYLLDQQAQAAQVVSQVSRGFSVVTHLSDDGLFLVKGPEQLPVADAVAQLSALPGFISIEPDFRYELQVTPNDPSFSSLWGMHNASDVDIDAPEAWDVATGTSTTVVGMVDTGIDYNHPDLNDNVWINSLEIAGNFIDDDLNGFVDDVRGWDFWSNDSDPADVNSSSHGSHTSGTVGAEGNNGTGVVGVNWNVKIIGLKIGHTGSSVSGSAAVNAMNYVRNLKLRVTDPVNVRVTNHSWGGGGFDSNMNTAIANHAASGIITVCAAGNAGSNNDSFPFYPATYNQPNIISVGNHTQSNTRNGGSNFGATTVDLFAPGTNILSTIRTAVGSYGTLTGTSMASPHVAGVAALLFSVAPGATYQQVRDAIFQSVDVFPAYTGFCATNGRLNARGAVDRVANVPAVPAQPDLSSGSDTGQFDNDNITSDNTPTFSGSGVQAGLTIRIYSDAVQVGSGVVDGSGNWSVTTSALGNGVRQITARAVNGAVESGPSTALAVTIDTIAPTVTNAVYSYDLSPHRLGVVFSENVGWSVANSDFDVQNLTNPGAVVVSQAYNVPSNTSQISFPGFPVLPDARYRLTVLSAGIQDVAGNTLNNAVDFTHDFFFLMGDANHDATVNLLDFNIVAANFGQSPRDFTQGDFDYNFSVGLNDFNLLASRFGMSVAGVDGRGVFGQSPIGASKGSVSDDQEEEEFLA